MASFKELTQASVNYNRDSDFLPARRLKPIVAEKLVVKENKKRKLADIDDVVSSSSSSSLSLALSGVKGRINLHPDEIANAVKAMANDYTTPQIKAITAALSGKNVFLTGGPGTGKTHTLIKLHEVLRDNQINHILLAPDADTAIRMKSLTLDTWLNVASIYQPLDVLLKKVKKEKEKWISLKVMIIDNIGMLDIDYIVKINRILCTLKKSKLPFGGVCVVFASDLAQTPSNRSFKEHAKLFFEHDIWKFANLETFYLTHNFRHAHDQVLSGLLDRMRLGKVTEEDQRFCATLKKPRQVRERFPQLDDMKTPYAPVMWTGPGTVPLSIARPRLHYVRTKCDEDNEKALKNVQPKREMMVTFKVRETFNESSKILKEKSNQWLQVMRAGPVKEVITLCTGAQMLLLEDIIVPLAHPDIFIKDGKEPTAEEKKSGTMVIEKGAIGVVYGWSDEMISEIDGSATRFPYLQFDIKAAAAEGESKEEKTERTVDTLLPPVLIRQRKWENAETGASYAQLPLAHAWAVTIQDNSELFVDSMHMKTGSLIFDARQFYCCLSKVKSISKFSIESFDPAWLKIDPKICSLYKQLALGHEGVPKRDEESSLDAFVKVKKEEAE